MQIIAKLCKQFHELEKKYLLASKEFQDMQANATDEEIQGLERKMASYRTEIERLKAGKGQMEETILNQELQMAKLQKKMNAQEKRIQEYAQELEALRAYLHRIDQAVENDDAENADESVDQDEIWGNRKVLVVGGHVNWQNKLKERFPKWQYVAAGQKSFDGSMMRGRDIIVCNTESLAHACYFKVIAEKSRRQKLLYVHNSNIDRCLKELNAQMG